MTGKRIVVNYGNWAVYRPGNGKCDVEDIEPKYITHLIYCFMGLNTEGEIQVIDKFNDIENRAIERFNKLKIQNRELKTMVSIGGMNMGYEILSQVARSQEVRSKFADNICDFLEKYNFDGFSMDWNFPTDKIAYSKLLKKLREKFDEKNFILSATVLPRRDKVDECYNVPDLAKYLDFINIIASDLHDPKKMVTAFHAPLYRRSAEQRGDSEAQSVESVIDYWIEKGVPLNKVNLGVSFYGRTFTLVDPSNNGVGAPVFGPGFAGDYMEEEGVLCYSEINEKKKNWNCHWDDEQKVPYAYTEDQWISYENIDSIRSKAQFICDKELGGVAVWSVDHDDVHGLGDEGKHPLLHTVHSILQEPTISHG